MDNARKLEGSRSDLIVEPSAHRTLRTADKNAAGYFETVSVRTLADLQSLGFAPAQLTEDRVRKAMFDDEIEAMRSAPQPCGCGESRSAEMSPRPSNQSGHTDVRRSRHPHLARLVEEQAGRKYAWDSLPVRVLAGAMERIALGPFIMQVALIRDIVVQTNATLTIDPGVTLIRARDIKLSVGAKLIVPTPYAKIVCRSVKGDLV